ncbi:arginase [Atractiella rhizophila]|nr:arginase [Atractiella rhizophila]
MPGFKFTNETVAVVGCPFSGGQPKGGVDEGPMQLVSSGLLDDIKNLGWTVSFSGHQSFPHILPQNREADPPIGKLKNPRTVSKVCEEVAATVGEHAKKGELVLTLGGDHSLAMGTNEGVRSAHPDACLIWIDAHADINTPNSTDSGNLHGCPVSFLLRLEGTDIPEFSWITGEGNEKKRLRSDRIAYIGLRDVDVGEKKIIKDLGITAFSMYHVDKYGIAQVLERALDAVNPARDRPIHLTFDVDAMDPSVAPSTGTPVRGGLSFREGHYICEALAETGLLVAVDIMEVNPSLEDAKAVQQTVSVGRSLVRCALGETLL